MSSKKKKKEKAPDSKPELWNQVSEKKQHLICLGFLFLLPFILFYSSTLGGQQYMGNDAIQWRAGAESLIEHREKFNEVAHWAANMFSGMPATTISHPPQIWNVDTFVKALNGIFPAVEYWILFSGAYVMFLLMGFRPLAAVLVRWQSDSVRTYPSLLARAIPRSLWHISIFRGFMWDTF